MQLKGLVKIFAIALILICLYQLSFTWFVHNHENNMESRAEKWLKANFATPEQKYPGSKELQAAYADSLEQLKDNRLRRLLDSTKGDKIVLGMGTYQYAKDQELMLGLDLQGGMNVTMEVSLDGLIRSLASFSKDPGFNKAIQEANRRKSTSGADYISLFKEEFQRVNGNGKLAPLFAAKSNKRITYGSSDNEVISYIRTESQSAVQNTFNILRTRIDKFGVAAPTINLDQSKNIITVELAGVTDPERVRRYLQSTANLQFFEVYNIGELDQSLVNAQKALSNYLNGVQPADTAASVNDTIGKVAAAGDTLKPAGGTQKISDLAAGQNAGKKVTDTARNTAPLTSILQIIPPQQGRDGKPQFPAALGYIQTKDTGTLNSYLDLPVVKDKFPANLVFMYGKPEGEDAKARSILPLYAVKTVEGATMAKLEGEHVTDAGQDYDERGRVAIKMNMDKEGERIWAKMTRENIGKPIAIVMDNVVYSAPFVENEIPNGNSQITGSYSVVEAKDLSDILKSGKLPAPANIVQEQVVGPTLGQDAIQGGSMAFLVAFVIIFALMLIYFNTAGWVANIALILNLLFTIGILSALGATLTAPGIAGLVLTIGLAVDTNVIIFERIKEELTRGKNYQEAVDQGYRRSLAPVLDAHVTTLLTALILFYFGLGPVLGFATTQILGILLSLFCGILISRLISDWYTKKNRHFEYFTAISRKIFKHASFKFIEYRKIAYGISVVVLLLGVGSFFNGFDQGVEFSGGRSYTIRFDKPVEEDQVREQLNKTFGENTVVKTIGNNSQLNITTPYLINESANNTDSIVEAKLYDGLKAFLPAGLTYREFDTRYKQSSQTVLPTISDDLKQGATTATIVSLLAICLYIFIRFRDWRYSLGTIVALLHDVFVTLAVFSFFKGVVPFPLEIDQHFIAAILTVIGFSMNDTVIVFDRIREDSAIMKNADKGVVINRAINETLSRTIMTSLTVFLTILSLFIFGGEVTRGFAFAMLIGVVTGTYSSIFVAAPILVDLAKDRPLGSKSTVETSSAPIRTKPVKA
ncbi:protein translocase subunit SecDF [Segetibacter sp. 3557_3]|uniref:protein translocase subunit SecDF n=1 Tax=Segetibacter sp. 3557_3 TaxID=2547429 RepID=UPI001058DFEF|nr:protein translocase subunit SecDF [Segetibacter sp. 3557_3]TDH28505.1 protein translocase subunit SecDF [Segetibacter sp. 3557_3]